MLEVTKAGQDAMAAHIAKARQAREESPRAEDLSGDAMTAGMEAARATQDGCDGEPDSGRDAMKRIQPDAATMLRPGPISPEQYQRGPLTEGHAALSHQHGEPAVKLTPLTVHGSGPMVKVLRGGRD